MYEPTAAEEAKMQELDNAQKNQNMADKGEKIADAFKAKFQDLRRRAEAANFKFRFSEQSTAEGVGAMQEGDSVSTTVHGGISGDRMIGLREASISQLDEMIALAEGNIANNKKRITKLGKKDEAKKEELREQNVNEGNFIRHFNISQGNKCQRSTDQRHERENARRRQKAG